MTTQPRRLAWLAVAGLGLIGVAIALALTSGHERHRNLTAVIGALVALSFIAGGIVAWWRRPGNRTGPLMAGVGFAFVLSGLQQANESWLYTVGTVLGAMYLAVFVHLLLAYPDGRLHGRLERILVPAAYALALLAELVPSLLHTELDPSCKHDCPENAFLVHASPTAVDALDALFTVVTIALFAAVAVLLLRRWRAASVAARRTLAPVFLSGGLAVVFITATFAVRSVSQTAGDILLYIAFFWFAVLPLLFLGGLLRTRLARVAAARMLLETPQEPTLAEAQEGLRRALGDPTLELLVWDPDGQAYIDARGRTREYPRETVMRAVELLQDSHGRPLAALSHDVALRQEPDLLAEVVATSRLALEKDRGLQALRLSDERMRALLNALPDLMIRFRRDGTYLDIRGDTSGLVRPREQMLGRNVRDFLPPELVDRVMSCAAAALDTGATRTVEYDLEVGGELRHFEARMVPGSTDEIVSVVRDVTNERRLEHEIGRRLQEVQHEQSFTRTVVNTAPIVLMLCDVDGNIIRFNDTTEALTGRADDERVWGRAVSEVFLHPDDAAGFETAVRRVQPDRLPEQIECRWLTNDDDELVMDCTINHVLDGEGLHRRIVAALDVTEREKSRQELVRQRDLLGVVARATPNILFVAEADGLIAWEGVNPAFEAMTGHDDKTACGRHFWEFVVSPEDVERVQQEFEHAVAGGGIHVFSANLVNTAGERRSLDWSCRPLVGLDNRTKYLLCGVDITERERHLQGIRASRSRLIEAQDAERRRLERNLHDGAQQRLVSLSLALRLAQARLASDPEGAGDILASAGDELTLALGELRELARGIHPAMLTERGLGAAVESLAARAPLPVELGELPEERLPASVEAAAFYVISEALANIGKYAEASYARVSVTRDNGYAVVEVEDDGVGGADPSRGSGLRGLVDRVEALDGRLDVVSPEGSGTCIRAEIPCA
jgi:PAS domain S-box-containing protein